MPTVRRSAAGPTKYSAAQDRLALRCNLLRLTLINRARQLPECHASSRIRPLHRYGPGSGLSRVAIPYPQLPLGSGPLAHFRLVSPEWFFAGAHRRDDEAETRRSARVRLSTA